MTVSDKIKTIDNKIEEKKVQYDLGRQAAKISALSLGSVNRYESLTGKDVLREKDLLEKLLQSKDLNSLL